MITIENEEYENIEILEQPNYQIDCEIKILNE